MKMKIMIFVVSLILISSCKEREKRIYTPTKECINGVLYYIARGGFAPAFNLDGTLIPCKPIAR